MTGRAINGSVPLEEIALGVLVERKEVDHPWAEYSWRPAGVVPGGLDAGRWQVIAEGEGWAHLYAGVLTLGLFRKDTEGYRRNLSQAKPKVFVVLRENHQAEGPERVPFHLTVCPYEAESYTVSGDEVVEGVPMPAEVIAAVAAFVERHHVDEPFVKRKQKPKTEREEPFAARRDSRVRF